MLARLQQIQALGGSGDKEASIKQRVSAGLFAEKLEEKILSRVSHMDCEDLLDLVRCLSKIALPGSAYKSQKVQWVQKTMLEITERLEMPELNQEMRLLYTPDNWIAFMINANVIYQNQIVASGCPILESLKEANTKLGAVLAREFKRMIGSGTEFKTKDLLTIFD